MKEIITDFFWEGNRPKVAYNVLIQNIENGGLKLPDFETKVKALQITWVNRMTSSSNAKWKAFPKYFYKCCNLNVLFNSNIDITKQNKDIPNFYKSVYTSWSIVHSTAPKTVIGVQTQCLWNNRYITVENKPIFWKHWSNSGINRVADLLDCNGEFLSHIEIYK